MHTFLRIIEPTPIYTLSFIIIVPAPLSLGFIRFAEASWETSLQPCVILLLLPIVIFPLRTSIFAPKLIIGLQPILIPALL